MIALWAILTAGFGLAFGIMGNAFQLATLIAQGEIDAWLLQPRAVLPHMLLGRSAPSAWGDALFGYIVYLGFVAPGLAANGGVYSAQPGRWRRVHRLRSAGGSLSFFMGNAGALADQWRNPLISFSTYPPTLFQGAVKILLYTVIPAGFVSYLPVETLRSMSPMYALLSVGGALSVLAAGTGAFYWDSGDMSRETSFQ